MKILLLEDVKKLGKAGEIVDVSDGYAKNFIIPKKLGREATAQVMNNWKQQKASEANRKALEKHHVERKSRSGWTSFRFCHSQESGGSFKSAVWDRRRS